MLLDLTMLRPAGVLASSAQLPAFLLQSFLPLECTAQQGEVQQ